MFVNDVRFWHEADISGHFMSTFDPKQTSGNVARRELSLFRLNASGFHNGSPKLGF